MKVNDVAKRLNYLQSSREEFIKSGEYLIGHWVSSTVAKGKTYRQLRHWDNGKSKYVRTLNREETEQIKANIERGREIERLDIQITQTQIELEKMIATAHSLGFTIKNPLGDRNATAEWYTPPEFIKMALIVLGGIDLDPASNDYAQSWIKAGTYYTKHQDGLKQSWFGRVWCNPPYGSPEVRLLARKFLFEAIACYQSQTISSAILLLNRTGAKWYKHCVSQVSAICEVEKRIAFIDEYGVKQNSPRYYNDFLYLGRDIDKFKSIFSAIGEVREII
jgi:hypothetical protein